MDWILSKLAVGSWRDAADLEALKREDIGAILNARGDEGNPLIRADNEREEKYCHDNGIAYCHLSIPDYTAASEDQLIRGVAFIEKHIGIGRRVMVHCAGGFGRSPSLIAAYLVYKGYSSEEAVNLIKKRRRGAFTGDIGDHIPNIKRFESALAGNIDQIRRLAESENPCK